MTVDVGAPGVACPTSSACLAVASYTNNDPNLTLAEQWTRATTGSQSATSRLAARGALALACARSPLPMAASAWGLNHTAVALVPGPTPSQPDQSNGTGHAGLESARVKSWIAVARIAAYVR